MRFHPPLQQGRFVRRYKRFFMDFLGEDGEYHTAHCPNTGSLQGCLIEGAPVLVQPVDNPRRKLRFGWKAIQIDRTWVGVDTSLANGLVADAIREGGIPALAGYERVVPEVAYGREGSSRIDLLLSRGGQPIQPIQGKGKRPAYGGDERVYVEVKNTTLALSPGRAAFPDAVTERGRKHLLELADVVAQGYRAAMVFCVQRDDCELFVPADGIDPQYGHTLREVLAQGVEAYACAMAVTRDGIQLGRSLPLHLD